MVEINSTLLWQAFNFLVLLWLLKRYLYGPITEMLDKRTNQIENDLNEAKREREEAIELKQKYQNKLREGRLKAQDMVDEAEIRGKKRAREIIEKAEEESERVRDRKLAEVAQAKKEAANELRNQVATISLLAAGKLIEEKLDDKKHEELIIKYIDSLNQEKLGEVK